jgi:pimeloyl-ACP methyl ester carboxylesterase
MPAAPPTHYARSGDVDLAYQVIGDGPFDFVFVPGWIWNLELAWELPEIARFFERFARFSRLILFDKRGVGLSDRVTETTTLEQRADEGVLARRR